MINFAIILTNDHKSYLQVHPSSSEFDNYAPKLAITNRFPNGG